MKWKATLGLYLVIAFSMVLALVLLAPVGETGATVEVPEVEPPQPVGDALSKLDKELRALAEAPEGGPVTVYVLAEPGTDLSGVAEVTEVRPFMDQQLIVANVAPENVAKLAADPGVVAAEKFVPIEAPVPLTPGEERSALEELIEAAAEARAEAKQLRDSMLNRQPSRAAPADAAPAASAARAAPARTAAPTDWHGSDVIGAPAAWAKGFKGEGVNFADVDSGVDFGHPDLEGTQATYEDGPYEGWPIALDPRSMRGYYYNGWDSWTNYWNEWDYSWYADVGDVLYCNEGEREFYFDGYTYTIGEEIVDLSQSGEIRWSVHPDAQLPFFVSPSEEQWMPFILVDSTTAGVYDMVIADLNYDLWFDEFDDQATQADPVLSQDLGYYLDEPTVILTDTMYSIMPYWAGAGGTAPTWWGPPNDPSDYIKASGTITLPVGTWVWAENHWTPQNQIDGALFGDDGINDVSGGMVYYIADGVNPIPGMDYLYPGFGPGGSNPIPLNGQLVAFMLGSYFAGGGDHGTLVASAAVAGGAITDPISAFYEVSQYDTLAEFEDEFEGGGGNWDFESLWHIQNNSDCIDTPYFSPTRAAAFNIESTCNYSETLPATGTMTMTVPVALPEWTPETPFTAQLSFMSYEETECGISGPTDCQYDRRYVEVSADDGENWEYLWGSYEYGSVEGYWWQQTHDLGGYMGEEILIRFRFDSVDSALNDFAGWYVDDVKISIYEQIKADDEGTVQGPAPKANVIAIGDVYAVVNNMQGIYDAQTFLAYGVDGEANSGDEVADLVNFSFGDGSVDNDGWDFDSRLLAYYNQTYLPDTTFCVSSGNGGFGYGTINSPQGNSVVSVGASTMYGQSDVFGGALSEDQFNDGEIAHFSGRGPDAYGRPDPDVVATGAWGAGDTPLNLSYAWSGNVPFKDGGNAWYEWGGTSRSAPEACGVAALLYEAYEDDQGSYPDHETAREILMSSADDLNHSVLIQGAGRVNADRVTDVAGGLDGVYVSPSLLAAGEYQGTHYDSFANVLFPGDNWSQTFTVNNTGSTAKTVAIGDEVLKELETQIYDVEVKPYTSREDNAYPFHYFYGGDYFVVPDPDQAMDSALVRVMHASVDGSPLEVCFDGVLYDTDENSDNAYFGFVPFGEITNYKSLVPGDHLVEVFPAFSACQGTALVSANTTFDDFGDYTIVATDYITDITPIVLEDDNSLPGAGTAHLRVFHASPDVPAVDVKQPGGPYLFQNIGFQDASAYVAVDADVPYDFLVLPAGETDESKAIWEIDDIFFDEDQVYTGFLIGEALVDPPTVDFVLAYDTPTPDRFVVHGEGMVIPVPTGADFMQVQLDVPFEIFDFNYNDPNPYSVSNSRSQRWSVNVYDWDDRNGNGALWWDASGDGITNPLDRGDILEIAFTGDVPETEISRLNYSYNYSTEQEATVRLGDRPDLNEVVIGIAHRFPNDTRPMGSQAEKEFFYRDNPLKVKVVFYEKADWGLVAPSATSVSVPAGGSASFDANFTIPAAQDPGVYAGAITVDDGTHVSLIPTTVNVGVPGDELLFTLGGNDPAGTPYDNGRMFGGWSLGGSREAGDWRFYYYDANSGFEQQLLYVNNTWGELCDNMPALNETLVWGPNTGDQFSLLEPDKFGPYGNQWAGGTSSWWTNGDNTPLPESRAWANLDDGLNEVQFRNILSSGKPGSACGEGFEATVGVFGVDTPEGGILINSDDLSGDFTLDAVSPVDGLIAFASGFGEAQWFRNQEVDQGKHPYDDPPDDLLDGWVYEFESGNNWNIYAETFGPMSSWLDLYLLFDANGNGIYNPYDNREFVAHASGYGSNASLSYGGNFSSGNQVQDGTYAIVVYGQEVDSGDHFDLRLGLSGGDDLSIDGADASNNFRLDVTPGDPESLTVNWEVPGTGLWYGYMTFSMPWEEEPQNWFQGRGFFVPVLINVGATDFSGSSKTVESEAALTTYSGAHEVLTYTIVVENSGNEEAYVYLYDLLPEGAIYNIQSVPEDPEEPFDTIEFVARWWYANGEEHYMWPGDYCFGSNDLSAEASLSNNGYGDYICWSGNVGPSTSGKLYIEYQVKVEHGFGGFMTNKVDIKVDLGSGFGEFITRSATTYVGGVFMPVMSK